MLENQEKDKKQSNYEPIKIPRTFVFDQQIPENEYHLYIDPEEYYNEEFDVCKDEFQNYRSANKNKQMKMLTGIKPKRHKNNRLCLTTQSSNRNPNLAIGKYEILSKKTDIFDSFARKTNMKKENFEIFDKKILSNTNERSECISRVDKYDKSELFEKNDNLWKKDCLIDATTMKKTKTLQDFYKSSTETQPQYKWNKKEMELSREIRDNDKTQILIEKTKRAIRVNEMECAKLKRRVNDGLIYV